MERLWNAFIVGIFYLFCHLPTQESVIWKIQTVPIVFGENVKIKCIVSNGTCNINKTRQWTGGQGYKLLGLNGHTTDESKYAMEIHTSDLSFDLTVKRFSESDANSEYTCLCGKEQHTQMLMLNKTEYIIMPSYDDIIDHSFVDDYILYINITLKKIHPFPNCTFHYNDKTKILKTTQYKKGYNTYDIVRYNETISLRYLYIICRITWFFNCIVGEKNFQTNYKKYECPANNDVKSKHLWIGIVAVAFACILVVLFVVFLKRDYCIKRNDNQEGQEQQSNATSQPEETILMLNTSMHA